MANADITATQSTANMKASAPNLDFFGARVVSHPNEVPDFVRSTHQRLVSNAPPDDRMLMDILRLTEAHPAHVAVTLLRCAPSCDRAATIMWRTIASSGTAVEKVLPTLLCVLEDWPLHRVSTSDGNRMRVFALAATRVVWEILRLPWCPASFVEYSPRLLVALLFQVFASTLDMTKEVNTFWRGCQEQLSLPISINRCSIPFLPCSQGRSQCSQHDLGFALPAHRFAVQTMRALFRHLRCLDLLVAMERKHGWDTLLCADTHHYAMGLLAREMHCTSNHLCSCIALRLLGLLSTQEPRWDLPFLAFLVEVLECHDMREWSDSALEIISRRLQSKSKEKRHLALRGLVVLSKDPSLVRRGQQLKLHWGKQPLGLGWLRDADGKAVALILSVFLNELHDRATLISSPTALQLAESLLPLFDHVSLCAPSHSHRVWPRHFVPCGFSGLCPGGPGKTIACSFPLSFQQEKNHVHLLSICLFQAVMELVMDKGKKPLKKHVSQSLLPLFFHCHDENRQVAEAAPGLGTGTRLLCPELRCHLHISAALQASRETLLCAAKFLKRRRLKQLVKKEQLWKFVECLLAEDRSRAAEHLRQALPYLQSPQEPLREAAIRFMGRYLRRQQEETWLIYKALQDLTDDISPAISSLALQTLQLLRGAQRAPYSSGFRRCKTTSRRVGVGSQCGSLWKSMNN
ncbi:hypothetical protein Nmel_010063 [Mimus melanotis]